MRIKRAFQLSTLALGVSFLTGASAQAKALGPGAAVAESISRCELASLFPQVDSLKVIFQTFVQRAPSDTDYGGDLKMLAAIIDHADLFTHPLQSPSTFAAALADRVRLFNEHKAFADQFGDEAHAVRLSVASYFFGDWDQDLEAFPATARVFDENEIDVSYLAAEKKRYDDDSPRVGQNTSAEGKSVGMKELVAYRKELATLLDVSQLGKDPKTSKLREFYSALEENFFKLEDLSRGIVERVHIFREELNFINPDDVQDFAQKSSEGYFDENPFLEDATLHDWKRLVEMTTILIDCLNVFARAVEGSERYFDRDFVNLNHQRLGSLLEAMFETAYYDDDHYVDGKLVRSEAYQQISSIYRDLGENVPAYHRGWAALLKK